MPRRILVPTDFSAASHRAVEIGLTLAERFDATIHPLYVRQVYGDPSSLLFDPTGGQELLDRVEEILQANEVRARESLMGFVDNKDGVRYEGHIERGVSVSCTILESVRAYECDLVIMGTHGRRAVSRLLMGSVAERVVRLSPVPVMTTRDGAVGAFAPRKILVGYDSSTNSVEALRVAGAWARLLNSMLVLLHVVEPVVAPDFYAHPPPKAESEELIIHRSQLALERAAREFLTDVDWQATAVRGRASGSIVEYAGKLDCDLIVLATHGLSGVAHVLLGSVAERVVRAADVPVLTVRA